MMQKKKILTFIVLLIVLIIIGLVVKNTKTVIPNMPDFEKEIIFDQDIPDDAKDRLKKKIEEARVGLRQDQNNVDMWLSLAIQKNTAGDYYGAEEIWLFVGEQLAPENATSYENLGTLYHSKIKNYEKAEYYYLQTIQKYPGIGRVYIRLANLYIENGQKDKAIKILNDGIAIMYDPSELIQFKTTID